LKKITCCDGTGTVSVANTDRGCFTLSAYIGKKLNGCVTFTSGTFGNICCIVSLPGFQKAWFGGTDRMLYNGPADLRIEKQGSSDLILYFPAREMNPITVNTEEFIELLKPYCTDTMPQFADCVTGQPA